MKKYEFPKSQSDFLEQLVIPFAIYQFVDKRVVTLVVSKGFCELFGYEKKENAYLDMDNDMYKDTHPEDKARIAEAAIMFANEIEDYDVVYRSKKPSGDGYNIIHAEGKHYYAEDGSRLAQVMYTNEGTYLNGVFNYRELNKVYSEEIDDASQNKEHLYDYLTGLPSMNYFFELAEAGRISLINAGKRPIMLFFDFSGIKFYNSKYGTVEGDRLIKNFSRVLVNHFSNENCSRFGQDHFAVFTSDEDIIDIINQIFTETKSLNGGKSLPLRVGIYEDKYEVIKASQATDRAKIACNSLRDTYASDYKYFDDEMNKKVTDRQHIIDYIDEAIKEKWIEVYYQPIVRAINGRVSDEEALARWIDPVKGLIKPNEFIPILEQIKQAYKLDLYVLEEVLEKIKLQDKLGYGVVPQSINLSRSDFEMCDIVEEIKKRVDKAGVNRNLINIEITESVIGSDLDFMKQQIERFKELGFSVWMDDFGSEYSSLDFLQNIDFDVIKFDRRFMKHLFDGSNSRIVLSELLKLTNLLGIDTVCEGVEKEEQVKYLQEVGCSKLQGFYYNKPIPKEEIFERYKKGLKIGFEEMNQAPYYETIGRLNLYDLSALVNGEKSLSVYKSLPMGIVEIHDEWARCIRSNNSFKLFMNHNFGIDITSEKYAFSGVREIFGDEFVNGMKKCYYEEERIFMNGILPNGYNVQYYIKKVATNDVTKSIAIAVAVLSIVDNK
ncbi:MAG: EAL domain-containing protein [Bacilli bacterium]|nr:EAL domain-containing protein [Bacilli bacterium]